MRKHKSPPKVRKNDPRTADEFIREWIQHVGSVLAAEKLAELYRGHLHTWLGDPNRRFGPEVQLKISRAAKIPVEALQYRWTPIKDLDFWKWVKLFK